MADNLDAAFSLVCDDFGFKTLNEHQRNAQTIVIEKKTRCLLICRQDLVNVVFQALPLFIHVWNQAVKKIL